jgi:hypothetical protein
MFWGNKIRIIAFVAAGFFILTGTYNAVVINSESDMSSDVKFVKRLDEVYGITVAGREVATTVTWQKLTPPIPTKKIITKKHEIIQTVSKIESSTTSASEENIPEAAVQEQLYLTLIQVINVEKWPKGVKEDQYGGSLITNNGVIEELNVFLPEGLGLDISFAEMVGNVFEYDLNGELFSGMIYQADQHAYLVTLTNGPLEGTRLRFSNKAAMEAEQAQQHLAENNVDMSQFGNGDDVSPEAMLQNDLRMQEEAVRAQELNSAQPEQIY